MEVPEAMMLDLTLVVYRDRARDFYMEWDWILGLSMSEQENSLMPN